VIDLSPCDSAPGERPLRVAQLSQERVLHVHLWTNEEPQTGLCNALASLGGPYARVDWPKHSTKKSHGGWSDLDDEILSPAFDIKPTLVFMQLQTGGVVDAELVASLRRSCDPSAVFISWCGDVGRDPAWSHSIAPYFDAMLFSSMTQVEQHRAAGFPNAAYLQIGYDTDVHHDFSTEGREGVVFLGQNYTDKAWAQWMPDHEGQLRRDAVMALRDADLDFTVYGQNWDGHWGGARTLNREDSAYVYRHALAAVSISLTSKYKRYSSDRLLRALACAPVVLVKRFEEMSSWGLEHGKNCLIWNTPEELVAHARVVLSEGYSQRMHTIAAGGRYLALNQHTWGARMDEMRVYVDYIRGQR
jgi:hypothetical protein